MLIAASLNPTELYEAVHELIRMAYPGAEITLNNVLFNKAEVHIGLELTEKDDKWRLYGEINSSEPTTARVGEYLGGYDSAAAAVQQLKHDIKIFCLQLLREHRQSKISSYGILTGVRPSKIVHRLLDKSYTAEQIAQRLKEGYLIDEAKAGLLIEIAGHTHSFLPDPEEAGREASIYIGIPYCPSRCNYCSFPGAVLNSYKKGALPFMDNLIREMNGIGDYINEAGIKVQTIYVGGGTPTVLNVNDLLKIFTLLEDKFSSRQAAEITLEAGRPDTLSLDKLQLFKAAGVSRICINPQTMNDATLALIGRNHSKKEVIQAAESVRTVGIKHLNMDLIIGLPAETISDNMDSLEQVLKLKPDNITIHTLALKRGSPMALNGEAKILPQLLKETEQSLNYIYERLQEYRYLPYYLYRQKHTQSGTENIGYSVADSFCIYNIQMIEERQTIIGMGGGAGSKFIHPQKGTVTAFYNPKNPEAYCAALERLIKRKVDNLRALN